MPRFMVRNCAPPCRMGRVILYSRSAHLLWQHHSSQVKSNSQPTNKITKQPIDQSNNEPTTQPFTQPMIIAIRGVVSATTPNGWLGWSAESPISQGRRFLSFMFLCLFLCKQRQFYYYYCFDVRRRLSRGKDRLCVTPVFKHAVLRVISSALLELFFLCFEVVTYMTMRCK